MIQLKKLSARELNIKRMSLLKNFVASLPVER